MTIEDYLRSLLARPAVASSDFDLGPDGALPAADLRPAAVLIAVLPGSHGAEVLLTKRTSHLCDHPGQIALPGGGAEAGDSSIIATALREAHEEIGLLPGSVSVLGTLPAHETITAFHVVPVLSLIHAPYVPVPERHEVEEIFRVPLSHLLDRSNYRLESRYLHGQLWHYHVVPWGPYYIWGATARILYELAGRRG